MGLSGLEWPLLFVACFLALLAQIGSVATVCPPGLRFIRVRTVVTVSDFGASPDVPVSPFIVRSMRAAQLSQV